MRTVKLNKQEIVNFYNMAKNLTLEVSPKWGYSTSRNISMLEPIIKAIQESQQFGKNREDFKAYEKERQDLVQKYSVDSQGKPYTLKQGDQQVKAVAPENVDSFSDDMEKLKEKYPELTKDMESHIEKYNASIEEKEDVSFRVIKVSDFPLGLTQPMYNILWPQMEDPEEEEKK